MKLSRLAKRRVFNAYNDLLTDTAGRKYPGEVAGLANEYGVTTSTIHNIVKQEKMRPRRPGSTKDLRVIKGNWTSTVSTVNAGNKLLVYMERCKEGIYVKSADRDFFTWDVLEEMLEEALRLRDLAKKPR